MKLESLPFKLDGFSGAKDQDPEEFITNFKLAAEVLNWSPEKLPAIFHMCLKGAARIWFLRLGKDLTKDIGTIYTAFLGKYKSLGLDWSKEASFNSIRQLPQESVLAYTDRLIEKGAKMDKTDRELLQQFIRGLSPKARTHTIATGPENLEQACRTATLFESAKSYDVDLPIVQSLTPYPPPLMAQTIPNSAQYRQRTYQQTPVERAPPVYQNRQINATQEQCSYCKRLGHSIEVCRTRQRNNSRQTPQNSYIQRAPAYRPSSPPPRWPQTSPRRPSSLSYGQAGRQQGPVRPTRSFENTGRTFFGNNNNSTQVCYKCQQPGHFARECGQNRPTIPNEDWDDIPPPQNTVRKSVSFNDRKSLNF